MTDKEQDRPMLFQCKTCGWGVYQGICPWCPLGLKPPPPYPLDATSQQPKEKS